MKNLLLSKDTREQLDRFIENPTHGLLITGSKGSGKSTVLKWTAASLLVVSEENLSNNPFVLLLEPDDKGQIKVEAIRKINHFLSLKVASDKLSGIRRIALIDTADSMNLSAQNALLKNLEEPPEGSVFILTAANPYKLLPTVRSRLMQVRLSHPKPKEMEQYLTEYAVADAELVRQAIALSEGSIGTAIEIVKENVSHPLAKAVDTARKLLSSPMYERLLLINTLSKDSEQVLNVFRVTQLIASVALKKTSGNQHQRWIKAMDTAYTSESYLLHKANLKLTLTYFMLNL